MVAPILRSICFTLLAVFAQVNIAYANTHVFSEEEISIIEKSSVEDAIESRSATLVNQEPLTSAEIDQIVQIAKNEAVSFNEEQKIAFEEKLRNNLIQYNVTYKSMVAINDKVTPETLLEAQVDIWKKGATGELYTEQEIEDIGNQVYRAADKANKNNWRCRLLGSGCIDRGKKKREAMDEIRRGNQLYKEQQQQTACMNNFLTAWNEERKANPDSTVTSLYVPCGIDKTMSIEELQDAKDKAAISEDEKKVSCKITFNKDGENGDISKGCNQKKDEAKDNAVEDTTEDYNTIKITDRQPRSKRQANFKKCLDYKFEFNFWPPLVPSPITKCMCGLVLDLVVDYNAPTAIVEVLREKGTTFLALDDDVMKGMIEDLGDIDRGSSLVGPVQGVFSAGTNGITSFVPRKMLEVNVFGVAPLSRQELNASTREKGLVMACQVMSYFGSDGEGGGFGEMGDTIEAALGFYENVEKIQEGIETVKEIQEQVKMLTNINEWPIVKRLKSYKNMALAVKAMVESGTVDPHVLCQASHSLTEASSDVEQLGQMAASGSLDVPPTGTCTETSISAPNADGQRTGTIMRSKIQGYKDPAPIGFGSATPLPSNIMNAFKDEAMKTAPATLNQAVLQEKLATLTPRTEQDPNKPPYVFENRVSDKREYFLMTRDKDEKYVPYYTSSGDLVFLCDDSRQYYNPLTGKLVKGQWTRQSNGLLGVNYRRCIAAQEVAKNTCGDPFIYPKEQVTTAKVKESGLVDPNAVSTPILGMSQAETEELSRDIYDGTNNSPGAYDDPAVFAAADTNNDGRLSNEERRAHREKEVNDVDTLRKEALGDDTKEVAVVSDPKDLKEDTVSGRINELGGACVAGKPVGVWTGLVAIQGLQSGNKEQAIGALYALQPWAQEKIDEYKQESAEKAAAEKAKCEKEKAAGTTPEADTKSDEDYISDVAAGNETTKVTSCEAKAQRVKDEYSAKIAQVEEENAKANADETAAEEGEGLQDKMVAQAEETKAYMEKQKGDAESLWRSCKNNYGIGEDQISNNSSAADCPSGSAMKCLNSDSGDYDLPQSSCSSSKQKKMCYNPKTGKNDYSTDDAKMCRSVGRSIQAMQNRIDGYSKSLDSCKDAFSDSKENREKASNWRMHGPDCGGRKGERRDDVWYCDEERMDNPFESQSGTDNASNDSFCQSIGSGAGAVTSLFEGEDCAKIQDADRRKTCEEDTTVMQEMNASMKECEANFSGGTTGSSENQEKGGVCEGAGELMKGAREYTEAAEAKLKEYEKEAEEYIEGVGDDISEALGLDEMCGGEEKKDAEGNSTGETESNNCGIDMGDFGETMDDIKDAIASATDMMHTAGDFAARMDGLQRLLDGCNMQAKMQSMIANNAGIGFTMGYISSCDDRWHEGKPTLVQKLKNKLGDPSAFCPVSFLVKEGFGENPLTAFFEGMGMCVGMWGALEPRTGVTKDANGFRGAALSAFRGFSIAKSMKTIRWNKYEWNSGGWDIQRDHIPGMETQGLKMASPMPQFNMDYPHQSTCYPTGTADVMWDSRLTGKELGGGGPGMSQFMNMTPDALKVEAQKLVDEMFPAGGFDFSNIGNIQDAAKAFEALETTFENVRELSEKPGSQISMFFEKVLENLFKNLLNNGLLGAVGVDQTDAHTFTFWGSEGCTTSFCPTMTIPYYCANSDAGPHFRWHGEFAEDF